MESQTALLQMHSITAKQWAEGPVSDYNADFGEFVEYVNPVDHGEFDKAVEAAIANANKSDKGPERPAALAIQRCRRGGKTFMLHAIAAKLECKGTHTVIFVSLNSESRYLGGTEDAYEAILGRIAYEFTPCESMGISFDDFRRGFTGFAGVAAWVRKNNVILLVDELNVIPPEANGYQRMSNFLDALTGRKGSALLYSTHSRGTSDLLRNRLVGETQTTKLVSLRPHLWLMIPRLVNENCLRGILSEPTSQPSWWCAVLRGRIPALLLQNQSTVSTYSAQMFPSDISDHERVTALAAVITGDISLLPTHRDLFKAYSYMSERFKHGTSGEPRFAWPPFLVSQFDVLGKDCGSLRTALEDPSIEEAKAFEALTQLAVLVRLLTAQHHDLVPRNPNIPAGGSFHATEIFHAEHTVTTISGVVDAVKCAFANRPHVLQVVAVPYFASFPAYDFFVLHMKDGGWVVAAGYQCKQGREHPSEDASPELPLSVWIEGKCRKYRIRQDGAHAPTSTVRGWILLGESAQVMMLGVSVSEALPESPVARDPNKIGCCSAEQVWEAKNNPNVSSPNSSAGSEDVHEQQTQPALKRARN